MATYTARSRWTARLGRVTFYYASLEFIVLEPTEGNFTIGGMNAENAEHLKVLNRLQHDGFTLGTDLIQDVSLDMQMPLETLTEAALDRLMDFFLHTGNYTAAQSCDPTITAWAAELDLISGAITGKIRLPLVEGVITVSEGAEFDTLNFSGFNHLAPVIT